MSSDETLRIIRDNPNGIWIREIARKAHISPASVCNYLYGYRDNKGKFIKPKIKKYVQIEHIGNSSITIVRPR
ncbi:hypothetical protein K8R43_05885 [archaeon]|nr:hypothetical protein [archaeon]